MLKRLYVHNYTCLVNFTVELETLTTFVGGNGSGKTNVLRALEGLRNLLRGGGAVDECFPRFNRTKFVDVPVQRFELDVAGPGGLYRYALEVGVSERSTIRSERLEIEGRPLFRYEDGTARLFDEDGSPGPVFPYTSHRSFLANVEPSQVAPSLSWLLRWLERVAMFKLDPAQILASWTARSDDPVLATFGANFAAYYRRLVQDDPGAALALQAELRERLPGFQQFRFKSLGPEAKTLWVDFGGDDGPAYELPFFQLSDGQAVLVALYALLHAALGAASLVCIDEPDNFVALPEIQPWLGRLRSVLNERGQAILITHHPAAIDYLAPDLILVFDRVAGVTRVEELAIDRETGMLASDAIAEGWHAGSP